MKTEIAYKFVNHDVPPLETFKHTRIYQLKQKLVSGEKISSEDEDYIVSDSFFNNCISKLQGWAYDFRPFMKRYLILCGDNNIFRNYYAFNLDQIHNMLDDIVDIVEVFEVQNTLKDE